MMLRIRRAGALAVWSLSPRERPSPSARRRVGAASPAAAPHPAAATANVGINGLCGGVVVGSIPSNCGQGHSESRALRLFRERLNYTVGSISGSTSIPVDFVKPKLYDQPSDLPSPKPVIATGIHVNSYLIHSDPPGQASRCASHRAATIGFTPTCSVCRCFVDAHRGAVHRSCSRRRRTTRPPRRASSSRSSGTGDFARIDQQAHGRRSRSRPRPPSTTSA